MFTYVNGKGLVRLCLLGLYLVSMMGCGVYGSSRLFEDSAAYGATPVPHSNYPAIVKVIGVGGSGLCTGAFIAPRVVLTAAHCVLQQGTYSVYTSFAGKVTSSQVYRNGPGTVEDRRDIALIVFNYDVADPSQNQVFKIGSAVNLGERINIAGFGCTDYNGVGAGTLRKGSNEVWELDRDFVGLLSPIHYLTPSNEQHGIRGILGPENFAGSCFGDSGGPMWRNSGNQLALVGVAHAGGQYDSETNISEYVDIHYPANQQFLHDANNFFNFGIQWI